MRLPSILRFAGIRGNRDTAPVQHEEVVEAIDGDLILGQDRRIFGLLDTSNL